MQCSGDLEGQKISTGGNKTIDQIVPVATRPRRKPVDAEPASNWLNSDALNLQKVRDSQQADPVLSAVCD